MFKRMQPRFTLIFVLTAAVPLLLLGVFVGLFSVNNLRQQSENRLLDTSETVAQRIESFITVRTDELQLLIDVTVFSQERTSALLQNLLLQTDVYEEIRLVDAEGIVQQSFSRSRLVDESANVNLADSPAFQAIRDGADVYYSDIRFDTDIREPLMTVGIPVINVRSGQLDAVIIADFTFRPIWQFLTDLELEGDVNVFVTNPQTDKIIAHPDPSVVLRDTVFPTSEGFGRGQGLSADDVLFANQTIQLAQNTLTVVAEQPVSSALAVVQQLTTATAFLVVLSIVTTALVVALVVRQIVKPIAVLSDTAVQIRNGNLSLRAKTSSQDEIGVLATSFNSMTEQLENSINTLEERVKERTVDLVAARDEAERANEAKSAFLASTSHELRTPLNAILNYSQFIARGKWGDVNENQLDALNTITNSGRYLLNLINDLLDMSKIASGSLEIYKSDVDLNAEVEEVVTIAKGLVKSDDVKLITEIDPNLPAFEGDGIRIRQIMINIVSNACKFTEAGHIRIVARHDSDRFHFSVEDTGAGIDPEDHDAVFAAFQQTESGILEGKGTGLGMPISKSLAEAHGGDLWFESAYGEGSIFHLELPLMTKSEEDIKHSLAVS